MILSLPSHLFSMLLNILLGFLCGIGAVATDNDTAHQGPLPLLLVSFDGFRADYLRRFPMPNLKLLYSQGVLVEQLTNVFITKTFPNHYSLVTCAVFSVKDASLKTYPSSCLSGSVNRL